ncbi:unnamed protein product, partial [Allacma fusca]
PDLAFVNTVSVVVAHAPAVPVSPAHVKLIVLAAAATGVYKSVAAVLVAATGLEPFLLLLSNLQLKKLVLEPSPQGYDPINLRLEILILQNDLALLFKCLIKAEIRMLWIYMLLNRSGNRSKSSQGRRGMVATVVVTEDEIVVDVLELVLDRMVYTPTLPAGDGFVGTAEIWLRYTCEYFEAQSVL